MEKSLNYRKAYLDDVSRLVELRKKQLIDEGCYADNNIDKELQKYFSDSTILLLYFQMLQWSGIMRKTCHYKQRLYHHIQTRKCGGNVPKDMNGKQ